MERIVIQVEDKEKSKMLLELLKALDFVNLVEIGKKENEKTNTRQENSSYFFSLAGLWTDREISLESIRQKAWPRQHYGTM